MPTFGKGKRPCDEAWQRAGTGVGTSGRWLQQRWQPAARTGTLCVLLAIHSEHYCVAGVAPSAGQLPTQCWHHRNHALREDANSRLAYDKQYRHSSPLVVTWPTHRSRLNRQTALHHDCGTPQQHTQIAHSQLAHSAPTTRVVAIPVRDLLRYEVAYTSTSTVL